MSAMSEIAPRLTRAHAAEREYQRRKADVRRHQRRKADVRRRGVVAMDVAMEEMVRSMRLMTRAYAAWGERIRDSSSRGG